MGNNDPGTFGAVQSLRNIPGAGAFDTVVSAGSNQQVNALQSNTFASHHMEATAEKMLPTMGKGVTEVRPLQK